MLKWDLQPGNAYCDAILRAVKDTGLNRTAFAERCPYTLEQILS